MNKKEALRLRAVELFRTERNREAVIEKLAKEFGLKEITVRQYISGIKPRGYSGWALKAFWEKVKKFSNSYFSVLKKIYVKPRMASELSSSEVELIRRHLIPRGLVYKYRCGKRALYFMPHQIKEVYKILIGWGCQEAVRYLKRVAFEFEMERQKEERIDNPS